MNPKVSIIICTYNRAQFLPKALDSIFMQSFKNFEVLIIDNHSIDNTESIIESYKSKHPEIRYYKNLENTGISKSRNYGVSLGHGSYIAMLDSDDYWTDPEKLQKQATILDAKSEIGIISSNITFVKNNGAVIRKSDYKKSDKDIRKKMLIVNQISQSAVLFRKSVFEEMGGYDESLPVAEDYDLWLKIGRKYAFANLEESTTNYTVHESNISSRNISEFYRIMETIAQKNKKYYPNYWKSLIHAFFRNSTWFRKLNNTSILRKIKSLFF